MYLFDQFQGKTNGKDIQSATFQINVRNSKLIYYF